MAAMFNLILVITILLMNDSHTLHIYHPIPDDHPLKCHSSRSCLINCLNDECNNKTIVCPSSNHCEIKCHSSYSCLNTTIIGNNSLSLKIHVLSSYAAYNSIIYCPSNKSSICYIYDNYNKYIYHLDKHKCAHYESITLYCTNNNDLCHLSNVDYKCTNSFNQINVNTHNRHLLRVTTYSPIMNATNKQNTENNPPLGLELSATDTLYLLVGAVGIIIICFLCVLILIICLYCKQNQNNSSQRHLYKQNIRHDDDHQVRDIDNKPVSNNELKGIRCVLLSFEDGRKIKIPIDINNMLSSSATNQTNGTNYLSDSMRDKLSDEHNKIVSAVIMESKSKSKSINKQASASPFDIIIEDVMDMNDNGNNLILTSDGHDNDNDNDNDNDSRTQLIEINSKKHHKIIQKSVSISIKKYRTRQNDHLNLGIDSIGDHDESNTNNTSQYASSQSSHPSDIELQIININKKNKKLKNKVTLNKLDDNDTDNDNDDNDNDNGRIRIHHRQSNSQPQMVKSVDKSSQKQKRPQTAHPISISPPIANDIKQVKGGVSAGVAGTGTGTGTNSTPFTSSFDSSDTVIEYKQKQKKKKHNILSQQHQSQPSLIPQSASFPNRIGNHDQYRGHIQQQINNNKISPSKKGLRRSSKLLPKPQPNINNINTNALHRTQSQQQHHDQSSHGQQHVQQPHNYPSTPPIPILSNKYISQQTLFAQMNMHHQQHQRTLQPNNNSNRSPSPSPSQIQIQILTNKFKNRIINSNVYNNNGNGKFHRHKSEPAIMPPFNYNVIDDIDYKQQQQHVQLKQRQHQKQHQHPYFRPPIKIVIMENMIIQKIIYQFG